MARHRQKKRFVLLKRGRIKPKSMKVYQIRIGLQVSSFSFTEVQYYPLTYCGAQCIVPKIISTFENLAQISQHTC